VTEPYTLSDLTTPRQPRRRRWLLPTLVAAAALLLLAAGGVAYLVLRTNSAATRPEDPRRSESALKEACHGAVDERLKSPGTAKYGGEFRRDSTPPELVGWVDSQNGFGAIVRSRWVCVANLTDVGWSVTSVEVTPW
jgi:hypothetical protein